MKRYLHYLLVLWGTTHFLAADDFMKNDQWTWLLYRTFEKHEIEEFKQKNEMFFAKEDISLFTQLVFSWNAFRPKKGYFSFWVQARETETKKWGSWHHMMDWGSGIQCSYKSAPQGFTRYEFVRLETNDSAADGFRVRIAAHEGASLELLKAFSVSLSNFNLFKAENVEDLPELCSVKIEKVPMLSQFLLDHPKNDSMCSPTSCSMLASFILQEPIDPLEFAHNSFDNGLNAYGSWPFNMANAFEKCQGSLWFFTGRLNSFARLHQRLQQGFPVVVSVRGYLPGQASAYKSGHLLVVTGYDAKTQEVICHDPAFKHEHAVMHRYALKHFVEAWERSKRLAYVAEMARTL